MDPRLTTDHLRFFEQSGEIKRGPAPITPAEWQRAWLEAKFLQGKAFKRTQELYRELRAIEADRDALRDQIDSME